MSQFTHGLTGTARVRLRDGRVLVGQVLDASDGFLEVNAGLATRDLMGEIRRPPKRRAIRSAAVKEIEWLGSPE